MKKNPTTGPKTKLGNQYTYEIDKIVNEVVNNINQGLIDNKKMLNEKYINLTFDKDRLKVKGDITINDLKKWKNEFLTMNKLNPFKDALTAQ